MLRAAPPIPFSVSSRGRRGAFPVSAHPPLSPPSSAPPPFCGPRRDARLPSIRRSGPRGVVLGLSPAPPATFLAQPPRPQECVPTGSCARSPAAAPAGAAPRRGAVRPRGFLPLTLLPTLLVLGRGCCLVCRPVCSLFGSVSAGMRPSPGGVDASAWSGEYRRKDSPGGGGAPELLVK